ncbi:hypothetical protein D3C73_960370 [compost metagenome]
MGGEQAEYKEMVFFILDDALDRGWRGSHCRIGTADCKWRNSFQKHSRYSDLSFDSSWLRHACERLRPTGIFCVPYSELHGYRGVSAEGLAICSGRPVRTCIA